MTESSDLAGAAVAPAGHDVAAELLAFLEAKTKTTWEADQDIFAVGGMSSLFAMQLVVHLEKTYAVTISGADLMLDNFRTVDTMVRLVRRLGPGATDAPGTAGTGDTGGE
ncbi:acyl carrier protein [Streptomyces sp. NPDC007983]|uniref:acyl carrier protein n=1 Tax=Streptomyces sp. NPDC007983 TaxID=3364800 RepID=UPI0036E11B98